MSDSLPRAIESPPPPRSFQALVLPWLFSSTVHMLLALVLAISLSFSAPQGQAPGSLHSLIVTIGSSDGTRGTGGDARVESGDSTDSADAGSENPEATYYDDEPARGSFFAEPAEPSESSGGGPAVLASLLNEQPSVDLRGVLPASGTSAGAGAGHDSGVGSATGLTSHPRGSSQLRGGRARTGVFGASGEGHKFVYVFDRSGSMDGHNGAPLAAAKAELGQSLQDLGQTHQFQIIFYNEQPRIFNPSGSPGRLVFGTDQNKRLAGRFVGSITASGATRHVEALEMALRMAPDVIFFLTDADEPRMTSQQLAHIAQRNAGTAINTIEFGYGSQHDADNFLVKLARQNGGQHVYVDVSRLPSPRR